MVAATGAALVSMVARITRNADLALRADALRDALLEAGDRDERAYGEVIAAQALPKADQAQRAARSQRLQTALEAAAREPLHAAGLCLELLGLSNEAIAGASPALASDAACAAEFVAAALAACAYNVRVNHRYMKDAAGIRDGEAALQPIEREAAMLLNSIRRAPTLRPER
jgi:formiminotetrahydrofolate cyclodeaminase